MERYDNEVYMSCRCRSLTVRVNAVGVYRTVCVVVNFDGNNRSIARPSELCRIVVVLVKRWWTTTHTHTRRQRSVASVFLDRHHANTCRFGQQAYMCEWCVRASPLCFRHSMYFKTFFFGRIMRVAYKFSVQSLCNACSTDSALNYYHWIWCVSNRNRTVNVTHRLKTIMHIK